MNQSPSGPNQPLSQHPLPSGEKYVLGKDADLLLDADQTVDTLLVPPPPEGAAREVLSDRENAITLFAKSAAGARTTQLIYKDGFGNEIPLNSTGWGGAGDSFNNWGVGTFSSFILMPEDLGLFLRQTTPPDGELSALSGWRDVRNVMRKRTELSTTFKQITPDVPEGTVLSGSVLRIDGPESWVLNYDSAPIDVIYRYRFGSKVIDKTPGINSVAGGVGPFNTAQVVPPGAVVEAALTVAAKTKAPVLNYHYGLTNQAPVRQDQGGAY